MSMIGFAARPGTEVEPVCSARTSVSPSSERRRLASRSNSFGHSGSYSARVMVELWVGSKSTLAARISASDEGVVMILLPS